MTDNKKSALKQLKNLYPAQLLNDDGTVKCNLGPSVMVNAILELSERADSIESRLEALENMLHANLYVKDNRLYMVSVKGEPIQISHFVETTDSRTIEQRLEAKPRKMLSVTSAHYALIKDYLIDGCLNGVLVVVDDHEERDPNKAYLVDVPKTTDSRTIEYEHNGERYSNDGSGTPVNLTDTRQGSTNAIELPADTFDKLFGYPGKCWTGEPKFINVGSTTFIRAKKSETK